jgi:hypothetical protein
MANNEHMMVIVRAQQAAMELLQQTVAELRARVQHLEERGAQPVVFGATGTAERVALPGMLTRLAAAGKFPVITVSSHGAGNTANLLTENDDEWHSTSTANS